jgi:hypothetical protein
MDSLHRATMASLLASQLGYQIVCALHPTMRSAVTAKERWAWISCTITRKTAQWIDFTLLGILRMVLKTIRNMPGQGRAMLG